MKSQYDKMNLQMENVLVVANIFWFVPRISPGQFSKTKSFQQVEITEMSLVPPNKVLSIYMTSYRTPDNILKQIQILMQSVMYLLSSAIKQLFYQSELKSVFLLPKWVHTVHSGTTECNKNSRSFSLMCIAFHKITETSISI